MIGLENSRCLPDSTYQMQHKAQRDMVNSFSRALQVVCLISLWLLIGSFQYFSGLRRSDSSLHTLSSFSSLSHKFFALPSKIDFFAFGITTLTRKVVFDEILLHIAPSVLIVMFNLVLLFR